MPKKKIKKVVGIKRKVVLKHHHKTMLETHPIAMLTPLFAAFAWLSFLIIRTDEVLKDIMFSPARLDAQINSLFAFIVIYGLFLLFLFWKTEKLIAEYSKTAKKTR